MPWFWILIIASAVVGPFEAYYVIHKAWQRKKEREQKSALKKTDDRCNPS